MPKRYLPLHNADEKKSHVVISYRIMHMVTGSLPLCGLMVCLFLTLYKDFESANNTHCGVPNVFPSISAAIGNYYPQIYIWQTVVYVHAPSRFFTVLQKLKYYKSVIREDCVGLVYVSMLLNLTENLSLLGLTFWTSVGYYPYHELCFKLFMACSMPSMLMVCVLLSRCRRRRRAGTAVAAERRSLTLKRNFFLINAVAFTGSAYCFLRHQMLCEPYMYSIFGFTEYIMVLSNLGFHYTTIHDFHRRSVVISKHGIFLK